MKDSILLRRAAETIGPGKCIMMAIAEAMGESETAWRRVRVPTILTEHVRKFNHRFSGFYGANEEVASFNDNVLFSRVEHEYGCCDFSWEREDPQYDHLFNPARALLHFLADLQETREATYEEVTCPCESCERARSFTVRREFAERQGTEGLESLSISLPARYGPYKGLVAQKEMAAGGQAFGPQLGSPARAKAVAWAE